ncbi:hypothetical protein IFM89_014001 [Coptis chinensis]|uniref:KIB1-4 beta-propeller domain-containing protein n=1 Tax=Coptis chinensis TaxID=261450 RepID=A0A835IMJ1_9MAGN|nr:hypothetical protein IFM89_014001 [Coptis chinensis]
MGTYKSFYRDPLWASLTHPSFYKSSHEMSSRLGHGLPELTLMAIFSLKWFASHGDAFLTTIQCHSFLYSCRRSFLGLTKGGEEFDKTKVYELDLPEIHRHRCEPQIHDPTINQTRSRELMVSKVVLTYPKDPSEDFIAVAIHTVLKKIAIARPGDKTWTTIQNIPCVMDVIYFKQQLYGICANRKLYILDIKSNPPKASEVHVSFSLGFGCFLGVGINRYLVEWSGELLQVLQHESPKEEGEEGGIKKFYTNAFYVFKLDFVYNIWRLVESLGQHALFLGFNTSVSVLASAETIFKRNFIYFVEDHRMQYYRTNVNIEISFDMGVFNLEDRKVRPFSTNTTSASPFSPPVWIISKLNS